jgi:hypothetical protein
MNPKVIQGAAGSGRGGLVVGVIIQISMPKSKNGRAFSDTYGRWLQWRLTCAGREAAGA